MSASPPSGAPAVAAGSATLPATLAAVDLGSNSFHLVVARTTGGEPHIIDRLKETVRLAAGLTADKRLTPEAMERALACLARFGERVRHLPPGAVRAVGTSTLRLARNARVFLRRAEQALGHPIQVISGYEEARLIHLGVTHSLPPAAGRRVVIDIGGGSTELILAEGETPELLESLHVGCVSLTQSCFADGLLGRGALRRAVLAARQQFEPVAAAFRARGWQEAVGASGSVRAVFDVAREAGWIGDVLTPEALEKVAAALVAAGRIDRLALPGLGADRAPVFAGGFAVLQAACEALGIERLIVAGGALREGVLYDLFGRLQHDDARERAVIALRERFNVDPAQAQRVARTVTELLAQVAASWQLDDPEAARLLGWAAQLHELGLAVSHSQYHKHGAYLLQHADLAGFAREEQALLATLVRAHRRKFPREAFEALPAAWESRARRLALLLRIAVLLHRARRDEPPPPVRCTAAGRSMQLVFPPGWLAARPLTRADLEQEAEYWRAADCRLEFD
ncbi:MAG TPA: exopolyphosphatase [Gammaproteobacteria bacterium]|nr:exopolyphosphatase [Gammaproteobacteria bacterium]